MLLKIYYIFIYQIFIQAKSNASKEVRPTKVKFHLKNTTNEDREKLSEKSKNYQIYDNLFPNEKTINSFLNKQPNNPKPLKLDFGNLNEEDDKVQDIFSDDCFDDSNNGSDISNFESESEDINTQNSVKNL
jgi:hypothetical protein